MPTERTRGPTPTTSKRHSSPAGATSKKDPSAPKAAAKGCTWPGPCATDKALAGTMGKSSLNASAKKRGMASRSSPQLLEGCAKTAELDGEIRPPSMYAYLFAAKRQNRKLATCGVLPAWPLKNRRPGSAPNLRPAGVTTTNAAGRPLSAGVACGMLPPAWKPGGRYRPGLAGNTRPQSAATCGPRVAPLQRALNCENLVVTAPPDVIFQRDDFDGMCNGQEEPAKNGRAPHQTLEFTEGQVDQPAAALVEEPTPALSDDAPSTNSSTHKSPRPAPQLPFLSRSVSSPSPQRKSAATSPALSPARRSARPQTACARTSPSRSPRNPVSILKQKINSAKAFTASVQEIGCSAKSMRLAKLQQLRDGELSHSNAELARMRIAFTRFLGPDALSSDMHIDDLPALLTHLGFIHGDQPSVVQKVALQITSALTFNFEEFLFFTDKFADYEKTVILTHFNALADDRGRVHVRQLEDLFCRLELTPNPQAIREVLDLLITTGQASDLDFEGFLHVLVLYRATEGLSEAELQQIRRTFDPLACNGLLPTRRLRTLLVRLFGLRSPKIVDRLDHLVSAERGQSNYRKSLPELSFNECLLWARRYQLEEQAEGWRQFKRFDTDGSGQIERGELIEVLQALGYTPLDKVVDYFLGDDAEHDCSLSFREFSTLLEKFCETEGFLPEEVSEFQVAFHTFDRDKSGEIDLVEMLDLLRYLGFTTKLDEVYKVISMIDNDGGKLPGLNFREFLRVMRVHREKELVRITNVFESFMNHNTGTMPSLFVRAALGNMGSKPDRVTFKSIMQELGNPIALGINAFVSLVDRGRRVLVIERRKQAGFSDQEISLFSDLFEAYDKDANGTIECKELLSLLNDLQIPMRTHAERNHVLDMVESAQKEALKAGSGRDKLLYRPGRKPDLTFWELVHLLRLLRNREDAEDIDREELAVEECSFSLKEVAEFREIFGSCASAPTNPCHASTGSIGVGRSEGHVALRSQALQLPIQRGTVSTACDGEPLSPVTNPFAAAMELPPTCSVEDFRVMLQGMGVRLTHVHLENIEKKTMEFAHPRLASQKSVDFPGFLRMMRWLLNENVAGVNTTAAKRAEQQQTPVWHSATSGPLVVKIP